MEYNLKYLYRAIYKDGTHYDQNAKDISVTDPTKSCYHDLNVSQVQHFMLSNGSVSYSLSLDDGSVTMNSTFKFWLSPEVLSDFKLVYFRRITLNLDNYNRTMLVNYILGYKAKNSMGEEVFNSIVIR